MTVPVQSIRVGVASLGDDDADTSLLDADEACCRSGAQSQPPTSDSAERAGPTDSGVSQAFHNNSPLPLTTRFLPFGAEPQRFDIFSLAAPEALSKKGAEVEIDVRLSDASIGSLALTQTTQGPRRAYSIGLNGHLQLLDFSEVRPTWIDLGAPSPDDQAAGANVEPQDRLTLDPAFQPLAVQFTFSNARHYDAVIVRDKRGRLWRYLGVWTDAPFAFERGDWDEFAAPAATLVDQVARLRNTTLGRREVAVIGLTDNKLQYVRGHGGQANGRRQDWADVNIVGNAPEFDSTSRLVDVLTDGWPAPSTANPTELVAIDKDGQPWLATLDFDYVQAPFPLIDVAWNALHDPLAPDPTRFAPGVRPVACRAANGVLTVYGTRAVNDSLTLRILQEDAGALAMIDYANVELAAGTPLQIDPQGYDRHGARVVLTAVHDGSEAILQLRDTDIDQVAALPANVGNPAPVASFMLAGAPVLLVGGDTETVYVQRLPDPATVANVESALVLPNAQIVDGFLQAPNQAAPENVVDVPDVNQAVIDQGGHTVFPFAAIPFAVGQWQVLQKTGVVRLQRDPGFGADEMRVLIGNLQVNDVLVLNGARYRVATPPIDVDPDPNVDDIRVGLNTIAGIGNGDHDFDAVDEIGAFDVIAEHEDTLLEITDIAPAVGDPVRLRFPAAAGTNPAEQAIVSRHGVVGASTWTLVDTAWAQAPAAGDFVEVLTADTNELITVTYPRNFQNPELAWEYFDGEGWRRFEGDFIDKTENFSRTGVIGFTVPAGLSIVEVAGQEDFFIRARLVGGDYGRPVYKVDSVDHGNNASTQSVTVDTSGLQPPEIQSVTATFKLEQKVEPEVLLVRNNLTSRNQTQAAASDSAVFDLFQGARALDDAASGSSGLSLHCGFTHAFGPGPVALFVDAVDVAGDGETVAEVLTDDGWQDVGIDDKSRGLRRRGFLRLSVNATPIRTRRFGKDRFWLRLRTAGTSGPWRPTLRRTALNAVAAVQSRTTTQEILGSSNGEPAQTFPLANPPVLPDSLELRVRENLTGEERDELLSRYGANAVVTFDDIDLDGDWVLWQRVDSFVPYAAEDRVYRLNASNGDIVFGESTRIPTAGRDNIRAIEYRSGGGTAGNVDAYRVTNLKTSLRGVDKVANPVPASGGTDTPDVAAQLPGSPALVRRAERALMPVDIEAMIVASSPDRLQARCVMPGGPGQPVRIAVLQRGTDACPRLSLTDQQGIRSLVLDAGWGALQETAVVVEDPQYVEVEVRTTLVASDSEHGAALRAAATQALNDLLDPVGKGPTGDGWTFGRPLWRADVQRRLSRLEHFDAIESLRIDYAAPAGETSMPRTGIVCASRIDVVVLFEGRRCGEDATT